MGITYRKLGIKDIDIAVESRVIFLKEIQTGYNAADETVLKDELRKYFSQAINDNSYISFIAEIAGKVVGTSGICITLLKMLMDEAKELKLSKVYLHATDNEINIYRKNGFIEPHWRVLEVNI